MLRYGSNLWNQKYKECLISSPIIFIAYQKLKRGNTKGYKGVRDWMKANMKQTARQISFFGKYGRHRCFAGGVRVITIRPGFLDTAMTYGLPGLFLVAWPEYAARRIVAALGRPGDIHYVPWFWRPIMLLIRLIPEFLFKRLRL